LKFQFYNKLLMPLWGRCNQRPEDFHRFLRGHFSRFSKAAALTEAMAAVMGSLPKPDELFQVVPGLDEDYKAALIKGDRNLPSKVFTRTTPTPIFPPPSHPPTHPPNESCRNGDFSLPR